MTRRHGIHDDPHSGFERRGRKSRPRTKKRPDFTEAVTGLVLTVGRGRYTVLIDGQEVTAMKARALGRKGVIVGDLVQVVGDISGVDGSLSRIVEVNDRETVLRRTADDDDPFERPIVANADQLLIVTALADPPPRVGMIDRIVVAAFDAGLRPVLCLTKADLETPDELVAAYSPLNIEIIVTEPGSDLAELHTILSGKTTVFLGHSGVGKSTLINALIPEANRATGGVNEVTGRGRHTSTSAIALPLPDGSGWVIDTPGVRSFGLNHVTLDAILGAFPDLIDYTDDCPRGCKHTNTDPECGLDLAMAEGKLSSARLDSFRRLENAWING